MQAYQINDLERITGIKAHTIRIWEKRYGIIVPDRTSTNRRFYNDDQVRKLLNVTTLLASGKKISKIATLTEDEMYAIIQSGTPDNTTDQICTAFINDLVKSMLSFDEAAFEKTFAAAVTRFGMYDAMINVVYPFLNKTGILWSINQTAPVQEHFATNIVRRKLLAAIDGVRPGLSDGKKYLLFLPTNEFHEIGLLLASYLIRSKGHEVIYLGQNVPQENISTIIPIIEPDYMLCFFIAALSKEDIARQIHYLADINPDVVLLVAGNPGLFPEAKSRQKNITYLTDVDSLSAHL
jgi:MerR family transcriptional regulator, light-induced transcriptional regulator